MCAPHPASTFASDDLSASLMADIFKMGLGGYLSVCQVG